MLTFAVGRSLTSGPDVSGHEAKGPVRIPGFKECNETVYRCAGAAADVCSGSIRNSADKEAKASKKGKDAETRQDYIAAYNFYHQAYELSPRI